MQCFWTVDHDALRVYGMDGFTYDASSSDFIPYADLTESQVLGWVWAGDVDKDGTQAALQASIDADKTPTTGTGFRGSNNRAVIMGELVHVRPCNCHSYGDGSVQRRPQTCLSRSGP